MKRVLFFLFTLLLLSTARIHILDSNSPPYDRVKVPSWSPIIHGLYSKVAPKPAAIPRIAFGTRNLTRHKKQSVGKPDRLLGI